MVSLTDDAARRRFQCVKVQKGVLAVASPNPNVNRSLSLVPASGKLNSSRPSASGRDVGAFAH